MAGTAAVGTGAIFTLGTTSTFTVDRLSFNMGGLSRESIETTHLLTPNARTFIASDLYDPGTLEIEFHVDSATPATTMDIETLMGANAETWNIAFSGGGDWGGNGFIKEITWNVPLEELGTGTMTFQCSGVISTTN